MSGVSSEEHRFGWEISHFHSHLHGILEVNEVGSEEHRFGWKMIHLGEESLP